MAAPALVVYPGTLPGPSAVRLAPAERRLLSDLPGPQQLRGLQRDYLAVEELEWGLLDSTAALAWDAWWRTTLNAGLSWFAAAWPTPQGGASAVRRFLGTPKWQHLPGGFWRVTATAERRGRGLDPKVYAGDPYFANVALLVPFSGGTNGAAIPTGTAGIDLSSYGHQLAGVGGSGIGGKYQTTPARYGASVAGSNTDGAINFTSAGPPAEFVMGTADFTAECDAYMGIVSPISMSAFGVGSAGVSGSWTFGNGPSSPDFYRLAFYRNGSSTPFLTSAAEVWDSTNLGANWVTMAYSRVSGVGYLFANGILVGSAADATNYTLASTGPGVGSHVAAANPWKGYIANLRLTQGVGRYTTRYLPPIGPYPTF
jgi:hypothetical protein